ncbi:hypothetical protein PIB30_054139 [Stylosanthes scabra]|uniref:Uncharacterized protein n=1 Tax=Stylosanthes scabra TaxID=79078 RepID=A0ABU6YJW3_9FABA|nr:hypothetical protein [Stylosanthes scabra]
MSRFLLEVVLGWVQQGPRLAHSCPIYRVLVSLLEELSPAILKFCRFFGGRVDMTTSFTGTSDVRVGIYTVVFDRKAASLGEARVGGRHSLAFPLAKEADLVRTICNKYSYQTVQCNKVI